MITLNSRNQNACPMCRASIFQDEEQQNVSTQTREIETNNNRVETNNNRVETNNIETNNNNIEERFNNYVEDNINLYRNQLTNDDDYQAWLEQFINSLTNNTELSQLLINNTTHSNSISNFSDHQNPISTLLDPILINN
jgi:DNA repair exonuclease SbcCD ATPase subunit